MRRPLARSTALRRVRRLLRNGSDPEDRAPIAMSWSPSATCSLSFAPLRLPLGGDQPNQNTIDNDIASHGIPVAIPVRLRRNHRTIHAELTVFFPPFPLYEITMMRNRRGGNPFRQPGNSGGSIAVSTSSHCHGCTLGYSPIPAWVPQLGRVHPAVHSRWPYAGGAGPSTAAD
jgi:hypothetical protein